VVKIISVALVTALLSGCSSLEFRNLGKTATTTGITYVIAGPLPALASAATSMAYDEIMPDQPSVKTIKSKEQATAYIAESLFMNLLYAGIAWMLITFIAVPFIHRRGYDKAKNKYRKIKDG